MSRNFLIFLAVVVVITCFTILAGCTESPAPATPSPTTTPISSPVSVSKTVLFSDDLSQWRSGWESEYDGSSGKVFYSGNSLHIRDNDPPDGSLYHTLNKNFDDFILEVDTKMVAGTIDNWQGVTLRDRGNDNYYDCSVSADGYYGIQKWVNGQLIQLSGPTRSGYITTGIGATNRLHCEVNKNVISFSVNGNHLTTVTDTAFTEGKVTLSVNSCPPNSFTEVAYTNLVITTV